MSNKYNIYFNYITFILFLLLFFDGSGHFESMYVLIPCTYLILKEAPKTRIADIVS